MTSDPNATRRYPLEEEKRLSVEAPEGPPELPTVSPAHGRIGPYLLLWKLGASTATTVFAAQRSHERVVNRAVAIKTMNAGLTKDPALVDAFLDEARIAARITHPSVCAVHDVGRANDGTPYQVMDYLVGEPFVRLLPLIASRSTHFSLACAVRLTIGVCEGLHAIHDARDEYATPLHVVHGRVRPENLFAMYDGTVRVLDFGGASAADHQRLTKANTSPAAFPYMSPEQLRSETIDARSDIWSLGVVLWEMLTGKRLFRRGAHVATAVAVLEENIPRASAINPLVHPAFDAVIARMLDRDPDRRWETARDVADELEQALSYGFGTIAPGKLASWLDAVFPGCQEFRWQLIVRTSPDSVPEDDTVQKGAILPVSAARPPLPKVDPGLLRNLPGITPVQPFNVTQELDPAMLVGFSRAPNSEEQTLVVQTAELTPGRTPIGGFSAPFGHAAAQPVTPTPANPGVIQVPASVWNDASEADWGPNRKTFDVHSVRPGAATTSVILGSRRMRWIAAAAGVAAVSLFVLAWRAVVGPDRDLSATPVVAPISEPAAQVAPVPAAAAPKPQDTPPSAPPEATPPRAKEAPASSAAPVAAVPAPKAPATPAAALPKPARPTADALASQASGTPPSKKAAPPAQGPTGRLYLTSRSGPFLVSHSGKELETPVLIQLPEGKQIIYVRRDKNDARRAVSVNVTAGEITGVTVD